MKPRSVFVLVGFVMFAHGLLFHVWPELHELSWSSWGWVLYTSVGYGICCTAMSELKEQ